MLAPARGGPLAVSRLPVSDAIKLWSLLFYKSLLKQNPATNSQHHLLHTGAAAEFSGASNANIRAACCHLLTPTFEHPQLGSVQHDQLMTSHS